MKKYQFLAAILMLIFILTFRSTGYSTSVPDFDRCYGKVSGEWNYGRAPSGCNANSFGDDSLVYQDYRSLIFKDSSNRSEERVRYTREMDAVIRDAATLYFRKRKPTASEEELSWWVLGIRATASQESYWSHYREASDSRLKLMRGDRGHGHGMMQIDDRSHFPAIDQGIAWNLVSALTYGMDIFFRAWERAPQQSCVSGHSDFEARVRSAWAAYNGGSGKICRWTDLNNAWAQNDLNFYANLNARRWEPLVGNFLHSTSVNVACLMEKRENCDSLEGTSVKGMQSGALYRIDNRLYCVLHSNKAHCVTQFRDAICLRAYSSFSASDLREVSRETLNRYEPVTENRHQLCARFDKTLLSVGSVLSTKKRINLRSTPAGGLLSVVPSETSFSILDFELRNFPANDRYYKIQVGSQEGYLYSGNKKDAFSWTAFAKEGQGLGLQAREVEVVAERGINLRTVPGGLLKTAVPKGERLEVSETRIQGTENQVYYKVRYKGFTGYIYSGFLLPLNTTEQWTRILR